jgi:hypothetical protein
MDVNVIGDAESLSEVHAVVCGEVGGKSVKEMLSVSIVMKSLEEGSTKTVDLRLGNGPRSKNSRGAALSHSVVLVGVNFGGALGVVGGSNVGSDGGVSNVGGDGGVGSGDMSGGDGYGCGGRVGGDGMCNGDGRGGLNGVGDRSSKGGLVITGGRFVFLVGGGGLLLGRGGGMGSCTGGCTGSFSG